MNLYFPARIIFLLLAQCQRSWNCFHYTKFLRLYSSRVCNRIEYIEYNAQLVLGGVWRSERAHYFWTNTVCPRILNNQSMKWGFITDELILLSEIILLSCRS